MDSPIYRTAVAEIDRLKRDLLASEAAPLFQEYMKAQEVVLLYGRDAGPGVGAFRAQEVAPTQKGASHKEGTESARIVNAAREYLGERGTRLTSGEIARALESRGVEVSGKNKGSRVSAYLSAADDVFDNVRGQGYGLRSPASVANGHGH